MTDKKFLNEVKGVKEPIELYRTPCFLYFDTAAQKAQKVEKVTSSVDLVPTLVNLFDLPADRRYYVGDDIFGDKGGFVMMPNYAWYDGTVYYSSEYEGEMTPEMTERTADVRERMTASFDTLKSDYFKSWKTD